MKTFQAKLSNPVQMPLLFLFGINAAEMKKPEDLATLMNTDAAPFDCSPETLDLGGFDSWLHCEKDPLR